MDSLIEQRGDYPRSVRKGKKQVNETASEQVEALIQQNNNSTQVGEQEIGVGGKRHFVDEGSSSSPPEATVEKPEKKHFVSKSSAPTLVPGSTGLGSAEEDSHQRRHPAIAMVEHAADQEGGVIAHDTVPSDLSGTTKPTKRVYKGLSGGVETVEVVKPPPKRSKTRRETTAANFIVPPQQQEKQQQDVVVAEASQIRVIEGARNKQDHLKTGAVPEPEKNTTRRHFLKEHNQQDRVTQILKGNSGIVVQPKMRKVPVVTMNDDHRAAGRASVDINLGASSSKGTAAASKVAAMAGTAMQGCLSWGNDGK